MLKRGVVKSLGLNISFFSVTIQFIPMSPLISSRSFLIKRSFVFIKFILIYSVQDILSFYSQIMSM